MEGGNSLEKAGLLYLGEGPWGLDGIEEGDGVRAHGTWRDHRRGCVRTGGLEKMRPLTMDQEADARTVEAEVWFWDRSLKN